jgi:hypothetical protein
VPETATALARRFFEILAEKDDEALSTFVHLDVVFAPAMFPGRVYSGREEVLRGFYEIVFSLPAYRPEASKFTELETDTVLAEGRIHFVDGRGSLHDKSAFWILTFADERLLSLHGKGSRAEALKLVAQPSG